MKKIIFVFTTLLIIIFANNVVRAADDYYGTVTKLSNGEATVTGTTDVVLKYDRLTLTWYEADPLIGRNKNGYWVGYRIDFPESLGGSSAEASQVEKVKYQTRFPGYEWSVDKSFYNNKDGQWYLTGWAEVRQERLDENDGEFTLYEARFDWDGNGTFDQTLKLNINANETILDKTNVTTVMVKETGNGASDEVKTFTIQTGKSLKEGLSEYELDVLETIKNKEGFVKFYKEGKENEEFSFDEVINDSEVIIYALFDVKVSDTEPEPSPEASPKTEVPAKPKDTTPKTGVIDIIGYVVIATVISAIGIITIRKKNNN